MREIKFRAWVGISKRMIDVVGIEWREKCTAIVESYITSSVYYEEGAKVTLMQYTGLKDTNSKEIYEFDYLGDYCVFWGSGQYILQNISTGDIIMCNENTTSSREITGNRYETPREHKAMETDL